MPIHRTPCEWDKSLVRVTETCEDESCPAYVRFEKVPEPIWPVQGQKYRLIQVAEVLGKTVIVLIALPTGS